MEFDPNEAIELLVSPGPSKERFPYERQIRLCQFQTWIYFPGTYGTSPEWVRLVGSLAGVKYLNELVRQRGRLAPSAADEQRLLKNVNYAKLFDEIVSDYGGWTELVLMLEEMSDFERDLEKRIETAETVCAMIDYRFRYLVHGGTDRKQANISHSEFFRWKDPKKLSWKKIRERWSRNRQTAVFLYVIERLGLRLSPQFDGVGFFSSDISKDAANIRHLHRFFGTCAYIRKVLDGPENEPDGIHIPHSVERIRPQTEPLSESELERMASYKDERDKMRRS
jgi:hypothetical protein